MEEIKALEYDGDNVWFFIRLRKSRDVYILSYETFQDSGVLDRDFYYTDKDASELGVDDVMAYLIDMLYKWKRIIEENADKIAPAETARMLDGALNTRKENHENKS